MLKFQRRRPATRQPTATKMRINTKWVHRNLTSGAEVWAHYRIQPVDWTYKNIGHRRAVSQAMVDALVALTGHEVKFQIRTTPWPIDAFHRRQRENYPHRTKAFDELLGVSEDLIAYGLNSRRAHCYLSVRLEAHDLHPAQLAAVAAGNIPPNMGNLQSVVKELRDIESALGQPNFTAEPLTEVSLQKLFATALAPDMQLPDEKILSHAIQSNQDGIAPPVRVQYLPYSGEVAYTTTINGQPVSRYVTSRVAVTLGPQSVASAQPWMSWHTTLEYPVTLTAHLAIIDPSDLVGSAKRNGRRAASILEQQQEHGVITDPEMIRALKAGVQTQDEIEHGTPEVATRYAGVFVYQVTGATPEEAAERAQDLVHRASRQANIQMTGPDTADQYALWLGAAPAERLTHSGYLSQGPVRYLGHGAPHANAMAGDPQGFPIGNIGNSSEFLTFDQFGGTRRKRSNVVALIGAPGQGKSSLAGAMCFWNAHAGVRTTITDPSGPLARLTTHPNLRNDARHFNLTDAKPGALSPTLLVPDPVLGHLDEGETYEEAMDTVERRRKTVIADTLTMMLPPGITTGSQAGDVEMAMLTAINEVGAPFGINPWEYVEKLRQDGDFGALLAKAIEARAQYPDGALILPPNEISERQHSVLDQTLTVITMEGMPIPPKDSNPASWTRDQRSTIVTIYLASLLATSSIYRDRGLKMVFSDELGLSAAGPSSFADFFSRIAIDSRKWGACVLLAMQNASHLQPLGSEIDNLVGSWMVGQTSQSTATQIATLMHAEDGGVSETIAKLKVGQMLFRTWTGQTRVAAVDRWWWDKDLRQILDTNPEGEKHYVETLGDQV